MIIAIPTFKRHETIKNATLKMLERYGISKSEILIFVANHEEKAKYEKGLDGYKIIIGVEGIKNQRNFMVNFFPSGEKIFYLDDDIYEIEECKYDRYLVEKYLRSKKIEVSEQTISENKRKGHHLVPLQNFREFVDKGFQELQKTGYGIFGIYLAHNPFFMQPDKMTYDLCYIPSGCYGAYNDKTIKVTIEDKEDFQRSIKSYIKNKGVVRFNYITVKTNCYEEKGGMQETRTKKRVMDSAVYLARVYPNHCTLNLTKKSGYAEIRLRDKLKKTI